MDTRQTQPAPSPTVSTPGTTSPPSPVAQQNTWTPITPKNSWPQPGAPPPVCATWQTKLYSPARAYSPQEPSPSRACTPSVTTPPQQFYPSLKISGVVESDTARNLDKLETDGPLPEMLDHAVSWLARNLRTAVVEDGSGGLVDRPEIPLVALRELVANALVHRALDSDTSYSKDIVIRIGRDRITITNPGGLWAITTANLAEPGHKTAVNPALYEICKLAQTPGGSRVIEGEGNGIYEAQKAMREAGLPPIEFINKGFQFTAIIRRSTPQPEPASDSLAVEQATHELLYSYLRESGQRTVPEIIDATGLTRRQVTYNLRKLQQDGRVHFMDAPGKYGARYRALT